MPTSHFESEGSIQRASLTDDGVAAEHTWLCDQWPEGLRFPDALEVPRDDQPMESYQVVPRGVSLIREWAYVGKNPSSRDRSRALLLLYKQPHIYPNAPRGVIYPVGVRVQGFIERLNLKTFGSWTSGKDPKTAVQHIVLSGGRDHTATFREYKSAVNNIVASIYQSLDARQPAREDSDALFIGRRVFSKVGAHNRNVQSALEDGDDPMDNCKVFDNEWRVTQKVKVSMYIVDEVDSADGARVPCDARSLVEGDFVDVCIGFDIVTARNREHQVTHYVHLNIEHIMLLKSSMDTQMRRDSLPCQEQESVEESFVQGPGLDF
ncbi:hypothetical protein C8R47DRAFT_1069136 [Mycena vitilis]|nr:hypothetical protein C8R47DRAFT_1069136 [Mycena vitilis]